MKSVDRAVITAILWTSTAAFAGLSISIPAPTDDVHARQQLWDDPQLKDSTTKLFQAYYKLETSLLDTKESELLRLFGPPVEAHIPQGGYPHVVPDGYVLPSHRPDSVGFGGLGYEGGGRSYFLRIGDIGGALVFPYGREDHLSFVALYLKTDKDFVPLADVSKVDTRKKWDEARTEQIREFIKKAREKK